MNRLPNSVVIGMPTFLIVATINYHIDNAWLLWSTIIIGFLAGEKLCDIRDARRYPRGRPLDLSGRTLDELIGHRTRDSSGRT